MGIKDRLTKLEGTADSCIVCGWGPPAALRVEWDHDLEDENEEPEYCPVCGRPDTLVVRWPEDLDG